MVLNGFVDISCYCVINRVYEKSINLFVTNRLLQRFFSRLNGLFMYTTTDISIKRSLFHKSLGTNSDKYILLREQF